MKEIEIRLKKIN